MKQFYLKSLLLSLITLLALPAMAYDIYVGGIFYNLSDDEAEVTYSSSLGNSYKGDINIPFSIEHKGKTYSVTAIGNNAFYNCKYLSSIYIPDRITSIGNSAFSNCERLTSINIPNSVTDIGSNAFNNCVSLTRINIPNHVISIEVGAFRYCKKLAVITIGNSVTSIGNDAFYGCNSLTSINIPNSVTAIGDNAFYSCTNLTSINIGNSVKAIGNHAFYGCNTLTNIDIPNSVTAIGYYAFDGCSSLTSINIGKGVTSIGIYAFNGCTELTSINIDSENSIYDSRDACNGIIETSTNTLLIGRAKTIIPNSVKVIGERAFAGCAGLKSINIPNSVKVISESAFAGCTGLTSIDFGNGVTEIGNAAFYKCINLTNISIPNSVTSIGNNAFEDCTSLASINIGNSVTSIGNFAFDDCTNLKTVKLSESLMTIEASLFRNCTSLESISIPNSVYRIDTQAFQDCTNLKSIHIPQSVKEINIHAFCNCKKLESVELGDSITYIGELDTFDNNTKLFIKNGCVTLISIWRTNQKYRRDCFNVYDKETHKKITSFAIITPTSISKPFIDPSILDSMSVYVDNQKVESIKGLEANSNHYLNLAVYYHYNGRKQTFEIKNHLITLPQLQITGLQPKVISAGNVIVQAETNLDDAEENVGFEWRRTDWTDDFQSNSGKAYLYEGKMEGYIRNLYTEKLWKYRAYYESGSGQRYYSDWMGLDPTNTSYFEPTVHTYAQITVNGNTATVRGYAQRGTDNIASQGFMFWKQAASSRSKAPSVPGNATTIEVKGTVMEAELAGLAYNTKYSYVAYVTTAEGETFYGEVRQFTTGKADLPGDADGSGTLDEKDIVAIANAIARASAEDHTAADVNGDGTITIADIVALTNLLAK